MARIRKRSELWTWLVPPGLALLFLVGIFSLMPYSRMIGRWPLRIAEGEIMAYQRVFDLRHTVDRSIRPELTQLDDVAPKTGDQRALSDPRWRSMRYRAEAYDDTVTVRPLRTGDGGWVVRFPDDAFFRTQRQIVLIPASVPSISSRYAAEVAAELGLMAPEISLIQLRLNGTEGIFLKEERIDAGFLEKHRITDGALFSLRLDAARPDHLFPEMEEDTLAGAIVRQGLAEVMNGTRAPLSVIQADDAAAFLLMIHIEDRGDLLYDEGLFAYRWTTGRMLPVYRARREATTITEREMTGNIFSRLLEQPRFRAQLEARQAVLKEEVLQLRERFVAIDKTWLPVLAQGEDMGIVQARADRLKDELLVRIAERPSWEAFTKADRAPLLGPFADAIGGGLVALRPVEEVARQLGAEVDGDSLILRRGKYVITEDLVLPPGMALVLEKGVRLMIAPRVSVLVQGALMVRGTRLNPVFIRPLREDSAYGSIAVSANDSVPCELRGLRISGGSEARINGFLHTSMLSIHHALRTTVADCVIGGSRGEDALNIKYGTVSIQNCLFEDGYADLIDLDFVKGEVSDCIFRNGRDDSNGDGLDVSGSEVLVRACSFTRLLDKGMSVGEISHVLVLGCTFTANRLGMAVKDLSTAHVDGSGFVENVMIFGVYRKKQIYGGGRLFLYDNVFINNDRDREVDPLSSVTVGDRPDGEVWKAFGVVP